MRFNKKNKTMQTLLKHFRNKHVRHWVSILTILAISVASVNYSYETSMLFSALSGIPEHEAFDGTVMPIQEEPDWSNLTSEEYKMTYQELPKSKLVKIPEYRLDYLTYASADLKWGDSKYAAIRNTKTTYPVAYAGNYKLDDSGENVGSHPAVDIKAPKGTPVYAIANGVVYSAGTSSGFGKSIVVKHNNVPDPSNPGQTTTLYSSYSHLSEFFVSKGDKVQKGAVIGQVGNTGTATTYHLHFQIDSADSPWHPYWPFTTAEASAAGYGFWEAVNNGVGKDNLYRYTRNPMTFVKNNLDGSATIATTNFESIKQATTTTKTETVTVVDTTSTDTTVEDDVAQVEVIEEPVSVLPSIGFSSLKIETPAFLMQGQNGSITILLLDANGKTLDDAQFDGNMELSLSDSDVGKLSISSLNKNDFENGEATLNLYGNQVGDVTVYANVASQSHYSSAVHVINSVEPFAKFGVSADGWFVPGKPESIRVESRDLAGNPTPSFLGDGTVELSFAKGSGTFSSSKLSKKDFPTGVAEVTFTANKDEDVIIRVTYGSRSWESDTLQDRLFGDLADTDKYYGAVSYLYRKGTVQGYPDGSFKPENTVSRVEGLKFIFSGLDQPVKDGLISRFSDTRSGEWYSDYLATAYSLSVVQGYPDGSFKPTQGVNRVEFLKMLFATVDVSVDPVVSEDPYSDVDNLSWYAPYVQYAKEKNIFPVSGDTFEPGAPMSRLEVAELVYRMIAVQQNDGEPYSTLMRVE